MMIELHVARKNYYAEIDKRIMRHYMNSQLELTRKWLQELGYKQTDSLSKLAKEKTFICMMNDEIAFYVGSRMVTMQFGNNKHLVNMEIG